MERKEFFKICESDTRDIIKKAVDKLTISDLSQIVFNLTDNRIDIYRNTIEGITEALKGFSTPSNFFAALKLGKYDFKEQYFYFTSLGNINSFNFLDDIKSPFYKSEIINEIFNYMIEDLPRVEEIACLNNMLDSINDYTNMCPVFANVNPMDIIQFSVKLTGETHEAWEIFDYIAIEEYKNNLCEIYFVNQEGNTLIMLESDKCIEIKQAFNKIEQLQLNTADDLNCKTMLFYDELYKHFEKDRFINVDINSIMLL